ncbi:methyltransferase [Thioalkalivibrio sp. K90mix]|uniref:L-histidine N(alpha)-methyltransferase n=1 Tax=Thioalkalivibrio sp. (strain K90mix) TaxID=396595 RepID=UPI000195A9B3|nr:L-histidine N(alpha)-methyltransferase [Thioalkalivibrio sp. K90mix]ADC71456.1 methyltransferase [Thioalkalivibrio sp. K90mix]
MKPESPAIPLPERYTRHVVQVRDPHAELVADFREGMLEAPRWLPPKYFYDARGSQLFDAICDTPEYYPTRLESDLLESRAAEIIDTSGAHTLIELGSGTSRKTEYLLAALNERVDDPYYVANDVCGEILDEAAERLLGRFPSLTIEALCGDYVAALSALSTLDSGPGGARLFTFLGGSLGNFEDDEAIALLSQIRAAMGEADRLLLGLDRVKAIPVLEAAYNDAAGVTAAFNLNLLSVLNRELGADFDPDGFRHHAPFVEAHSRIEMHLVAEGAQTVQVSEPMATLHIADGETIRTEISRKFTRPMVGQLLSGAGLSLVTQWSAPDEAYSLFLLAPGSGPA